MPQAKSDQLCRPRPSGSVLIDFDPKVGRKQGAGGQAPQEPILRPLTPKAFCGPILDRDKSDVYAVRVTRQIPRRGSVAGFALTSLRLQ